MDLSGLGRLLIVIGVGLALVCGLLVLAARSGLPLGRLPGDFVVARGNFRFYLPLATSILLSLLLTLVVRALSKR
ncbi:MAG: DUF2905 domain-containing protein [Deltaproteobacteria bacterium]|nr:DUF2905 domain-containing protein [Deltaproteobacteria bacterium]